MGGPPMPPILLDHIAIALPRIADAPAALVAVLGGVPDESRRSGTFRWATWTFANGAAIEASEIAAERSIPWLDAAGARLGIRLLSRSA